MREILKMQASKVGIRGTVRTEKAVRQASETTERNEQVFGGGSIPWEYAGKRVMRSMTAKLTTVCRNGSIFVIVSHGSKIEQTCC